MFYPDAANIIRTIRMNEFCASEMQKVANLNSIKFKTFLMQLKCPENIKYIKIKECNYKTGLLRQ